MIKVLEDRKMIREKKVKKEQLILFGELDTNIEEKQEEVIKQEQKVELESEEKIAIRLLRDIQLDKMTPLDAFLKLNELKRILN